MMADSPIFAITKQIIRQKLFSTRMFVLLPILILFLPGMAWGFSDPDVMLPGGIKPADTMEVMFFTSLGIVFAATMGGVILSFDGVSRDRDSGVLEIKLSQPIPRTTYSNGIILGHWCSILIPTWALWGISMILVTNRLDDYPSINEIILSFVSVALILLWYVQFTLIASTLTKDQGTSVAFGIGTWFLFTFLWALITSMVAYASGVEIGDSKDTGWVTLEGFLDLLSPNGVFHHLLEINLPDIDRGVPSYVSILSALIWSILPWLWFNSRMRHIQP